MKELNIPVDKFVKKLQYLSERNQGKINVSNNAAIGDFIAYLMDKNSWKELKESLSQKTNSWNLTPIKFENVKNYEDPLILYLDIHKEKNLLNHVHLTSLFMNAGKELNQGLNLKDFYFFDFDEEVKKLQKSLSFMKIKNLYYTPSSTVKFGVYKNSLKAIDTLFIKNANTLMISDDMNMYRKFDLIYQQISEQNQLTLRIDPYKKSNFKIDLIEELFHADNFNDFFNCPDSKHFSNFWLILIQQIREEYQVSMTPEFLLKTLKIENLLFILNKIVEEKPFLLSFFISYFKLIGIEIDKTELKNNKLYLSEIKIESQHILNHFKLTQELFLKIKMIDKMYQDGIFESHGKNIMWALEHDKHIDLWMPHKNDTQHYHNYQQLVQIILNQSFSKLMTPIYIFNISGIMITHQEKINEYKILNSKDVQYFSEKHFSQVIFAKINHSIEFSDDFLKYFYLNTLKIDNIFYHEQELLKGLKSNQFYLWQKPDTDDFNPQCKLERFDLQNV